MDQNDASTLRESLQEGLQNAGESGTRNFLAVNIVEFLEENVAELEGNAFRSLELLQKETLHNPFEPT
jgi:hypothetical protein